VPERGGERRRRGQARLAGARVPSNPRNRLTAQRPLSNLARLAWLVFLLAAALVLAWRLPQPPAFATLVRSIPLHSFLETCAVAIAILIFALGWTIRTSARTWNPVFLYSAFLAVALIDFGHMLSFAGMPQFVTPASEEKSLLFWLAARFLDALALAALVLPSWKPLRRPGARYIFLATCLAYAGLVYWLGVYRADEIVGLPIYTHGAARFGVNAEYCIVAIRVLTFAALIWRPGRARPFHLLLLLAAVASAALSDLSVTFDAGAPGTFAVLGHLYKILGYCFVYRAIQLESLREPYDRRARSERALLQSEARFAIAFRASPVAMFLTTLEGGKYLDVNDCLLAGLGYRREEMIGRTASELQVWADADDRVKLIDVLRERRSVRDVEVRARTKNGEFRDSLLSAEVIEVEGQQCLLGMLLDITERKRTEKEIHWLASIVESTNDAVISANRDLIIDHWNRGAQTLLGYRAEEAIGKSLDILVPPERLNATHELAARVLAGEKNDSFDTEAMTNAGVRVAVSLTVSPIVDAKQTVVGLSCIARDIMVRVHTDAVIRELNETLECRVVERTAELESANRELEAFSYSVSHDLRSPLRAINGFAGMVVESESAALSKSGRDLLLRVVSSAKHMGRLIDDMLDFSRLSRSRLVATTVDMALLANAVFGELRDQYPRVEINISAMPEVRGDRAMLHQVYANLIGNALKFSAKREPPSVQVGVMDMAGKAVFYVKDNGAGFDMAYAAKLFGVFERLHSVEEYPGTGVGLAIVKRIIERHGGQIWAEAAPDEGATFYFTLHD
jgi:PAS domain S-box-containing protein